MNEFNVLLAAATNGTPSGSLFDALFARYIAPQESWRELESPLPITILAAGEDLIDYRIYGNTENGESVGVRTENLFDKNSEDNLRNHSIRSSTGEIVETNFYTVTHKINVTGGQPYVSEIFNSETIAYIYTVEYDGDDQFVKATSLTATGGTSYKVITLDAATTYIRMSLLTTLLGKIIFVPGSTAPTSYIPYGYKLPMVVRSGNLFDKSFEQGYYGAGDGVKGNSPRYVRSDDKIPVLSDETYTVSYICPKEGVPQSGVGTDSYIYFWAADSSYIGYQQIMEKGNQTFVTPSNAAYIAFTIGSGSGGSGTLSPSDVSNFMLNSGATALPYQPYSRTDIPIYIGSDPLAEDEYVDFGEQKIYRMEGGTLTPTDPPVPIPALPTIEGETIIDYNPSTTPAVEPEKMYIKYKPLHTSATIYGFRINPDEPNSSACVTYLADAVGMTPAAMGSTTFNYGSWADAFFMPKPCMLKFDGTVDYYLDPNDYSKKADGVTPSDYNNLAYGGNAMMEFPLIWYKYVPGVAKGEGYFYVANHKVNDTYKCWSNMDCDGNIIEHFYMPIYNGCTYDGKMRSISGLTLAPWSTTAYSASATYTVGAKVNYDGKMWKCTTAVETAEAFDPDKWEQFAFNGQTTVAEEIAQATACNTTAKVEWYIDTWNDRVLINGLLVLISKSIDTQGAFGRGKDIGSQAAKESYVTGSLDDKGLFYGSTANGTTAVKVFGMENWWSLVWHRTAGLIGGANNTYLYKMTASTADGSIADGYNTTGTGYPSVGGKPTASNYVKKMQFGLFGFLPIEVGAYSTQYYKDYYYNGSGFALLGGNSYYGVRDGAFCVGLHSGASGRTWDLAAAPSCKPCKTLTANHGEEMIQ